jgi:hypothetical protein
MYNSLTLNNFLVESSYINVQLVPGRGEDSVASLFRPRQRLWTDHSETCSLYRWLMPVKDITRSSAQNHSCQAVPVEQVEDTCASLDAISSCNQPNASVMVLSCPRAFSAFSKATVDTMMYLHPMFFNL